MQIGPSLLPKSFLSPCQQTNLLTDKHDWSQYLLAEVMIKFKGEAIAATTIAFVFFSFNQPIYTELSHISPKVHFLKTKFISYSYSYYLQYKKLQNVNKMHFKIFRNS